MAACIAVAGCAGGEEPAGDPPPSTDFATAIADIGGGPGGLGVGWVEPAAVEPGPSRIELIGDAVGPNASSIVESARSVERRLGFDPLEADRLLSVGGSYAFGLRVDGVDGAGFASAVGGGAGEAGVDAGEVTLIDADTYASVPPPLQDAGIQGLGSANAVSKDLVVLAISSRARSALLGEGDSLIDEPLYAAAADCLGDVIAAKLTPDSNLVSTDLGISLVAAGVRADGTEVLCTLGGDVARADEIESNLERLLGPDGRDPITAAPLSRSIASTSVDRGSPRGVEAVRAEIELAPGEDPGYVFELVSGAAVVGLLNGEGQTFVPFGSERESPGGPG